MYHRDFDHAVVIIHTHSDDSTGDLWYCSHDNDSGSPAAMPIGDVCAPLSTFVNFNCLSSLSMQLQAQRW